MSSTYENPRLNRLIKISATGLISDAVKYNEYLSMLKDRLCGLVVRVLGYRSGGPDSIPGTTRKK
jgi:hypothetical protein